MSLHVRCQYLVFLYVLCRITASTMLLNITAKYSLSNRLDDPTSKGVVIRYDTGLGEVCSRWENSGVDLSTAICCYGKSACGSMPRFCSTKADNGDSLGHQRSDSPSNFSNAMQKRIRIFPHDSRTRCGSDFFWPFETHVKLGPASSFLRRCRCWRHTIFEYLISQLEALPSR